jgi:hypothetical protein
LEGYRHEVISTDGTGQGHLAVDSAPELPARALTEFLG